MCSSSRKTNSASSAQFRVRYTLHHTTALLLSLLWVQKSTKKTHLKSKTISYHMMREIEAQETQCAVRALKQFPVVSTVMRREIRYFVHLRTYTSRIRDGKIRYFVSVRRTVTATKLAARCIRGSSTESIAYQRHHECNTRQHKQRWDHPRGS